MKPQNWRLSWCTFVFKTTNDFWWKLEPSHRTNLGSVFVKCSYFLKPCCNCAFQDSLLSISRKKKDECGFHAGVFYFYNFWLKFVLRKDLVLLLITSLHVATHGSKISIHYVGQVDAYLEISRTSTVGLSCDIVNG